MKISLLYNQSAGEGISSDELKDQIERAGHDVVRTVQREADTARLFDPRVELIVAAGGDGTIASAAKAVAGSGIPLAILPAWYREQHREKPRYQRSLARADRGVAACRSHPVRSGRCFKKGRRVHVCRGGGRRIDPCRHLRCEAGAESDHADVAAKVIADIRHYHEVLLRMKPCRFTLAADGSDFSGDYLLVEVLNIGSIGPNIVFSPDVSPSDGFLSLVTAGEEHRGALLSYLEHRVAGTPEHLALPSRLATTVEIDGCGAMHVDDECERAAAVGALSLRIRPAALHVLGSAS